MANPNPTTKFKPGVVTNPNGRPKKELAMTEALKSLLLIKDPIKKIQKYKVLLLKAISMAEHGDGEMIKYIINRFEGMPKGSTPIIGVDNRQIIVQPILGSRSEPCPKCGYNYDLHSDDSNK